MSDRKYYVYAYIRARDSANGYAGTPYYIGKGHGKRSHQKNRKRVKLPSDHSKVHILGENLSEQDAFQLEMFFIFIYGRIDKKTGYLRNLTDGGEGLSGYIASERQLEARSKSGIAKRGTKFSEESREKLRKFWADRKAAGIPSPNLGRKCKPEHIRKRADALKGHPKWYFGPSPNKGKTWPAEMKAKISASLTGKKHSPETVAKRKESNRLYWEDVRSGKRPPPSYFKSHKGNTISSISQSYNPGTDRV